jgi:hypothetical protein
MTSAFNGTGQLALMLGAYTGDTTRQNFTLVVGKSV